MEKRYSKACERNKEPIGDVLDEVLPETGLVLEIGSGTGQHAVAFADRFPSLTWQPTDRPGRLDSIRAWRRDADLPNLATPRTFDVFDDEPPVDEADAVVAINVIHIAPPEAIDPLFEHAAGLLDSGDFAVLYGPYRFRDRDLEPSNQQFDRRLRSGPGDRGLRVFEDVDDIASDHGFEHVETRRLPANNDIHWWRLD